MDRTLAGLVLLLLYELAVAICEFLLVALIFVFAGACAIGFFTKTSFVKAFCLELVTGCGLTLFVVLPVLLVDRVHAWIHRRKATDKTDGRMLSADLRIADIQKLDLNCLLSMPTQTTPIAHPRQPLRQAMLSIARTHPGLALAGLRIEIEVAVKDMARRKGVSLAQSDGVGKVLNKLLDVQALSQEEGKALHGLRSLLNCGAHGDSADPEVVEWLVAQSPKLLEALDQRLTALSMQAATPTATSP